MQTDLAKLLLGNAVGFHLAAKRIVDGGTGNEFPWPPFFACIGYAFELSLKAYILARDGTEKDCLDVGHDLQCGVHKAREYGMQAPSLDVTALLEQIGSHHRDHSFRYMKPMDVSALPDTVETLAGSGKHLTCVAAQLAELLP